MVYGEVDGKEEALGFLLDTFARFGMRATFFVECANYFYFGDATMKQIGKQIGVNESRVSQLHARAIQRLRKILTGATESPSLKLVQKPRKARMTSAPAAKRQSPKRRLHRVA